MKKPLLFISFLFLYIQGFSQMNAVSMPAAHGALYVMAGYNRNWFAKSDITFKGQEYDVTLQQVKADDSWKLYSPSEWQSHYPQFSFRGGYRFKGDNPVSIELGYDYMNYTVRSGQTVKLNGTANSNIYEADTILRPENFFYSQTNGAGLASLSFVKAFDFFYSRGDVHVFSAIIKIGGGVPISRLSVTMNDQHQDNGFKSAGYFFSGEAGLRYVFCRKIVVEATGKGAYIDYKDMKAVGTISASQVVMPFMAVCSVGYLFHL